MSNMIEMPLWLVILLCLFAGLATLDRLLVPSVRWFLRRRVNIVLEEFGQRLNIKIEPFKLTKREVLIDRLMYDPDVLDAVETYAETEGVPRNVVMERVERYAREIVPAFNAYFYFRIGYWIARKVAQLLYRVRLNISDEEALANIEPKSTVVFLMNHRSNMDYVLVAYLAASRTTLSYAVGEWARVWPLQTLIRAMGAYFVRRKSRNLLYRKVLARYIHMATAGGLTQAVYPEGGLTRDGRLGEPKLGLLDYMLRSFNPEGDRDLIFIPVGINYDRVLEDRSLLLGLKEGVPQATATQAAFRSMAFALRNFGQMAMGRWYRFGYACVSFGAPISMRRYCTDKDLRPAELDRSTRFEAVERIANELMKNLAKNIPVVPVSLVATVLQKESAPLSELELKAKVQRLMEELEDSSAKVYIPRRDREYAIEVGLRMLVLRRIVEKRDGLYERAKDQETILAYYANSIAHFRDG